MNFELKNDRKREEGNIFRDKQTTKKVLLNFLDVKMLMER